MVTGESYLVKNDDLIIITLRFFSLAESYLGKIEKKD